MKGGRRAKEETWQSVRGEHRRQLLQSRVNKAKRDRQQEPKSRRESGQEIERGISTVDKRGAVKKGDCCMLQAIRAYKALNKHVTAADDQSMSD